MTGNFFIWCAGSDKSILNKCSDAERIKHIGFGTLVIVPAFLAFISMSYALSTIKQISNIPEIYLLGGLLWGLIIFAFDRFIVSTHRKKSNHKDELKSPSFFLRIFFSLILGIVISHPLVLLYFDGSITDQIKKDIYNQKDSIYNEYKTKIRVLEKKIQEIDSVTEIKEKKRDEQASIVEMEIDGIVKRNAKGQIITTGIQGEGPSARKKIEYLEKLQTELTDRKKEAKGLKSSIINEIKKLSSKRDSLVSSFTLSFDYLKRELALEKLKKENNIVTITQWLLIILFILVDILPVTFKTFSPFGMYDKILLDDSILLKDIPTDSRKEVLESAYKEISRVYADNKDLNIKGREKSDLKKSFENIVSKYGIVRNILFGFIFGFVIFIIIIIYLDDKMITQDLIKFVGLSTIIPSFIVGIIIEILKYILKDNKKWIK